MIKGITYYYLYFKLIFLIKFILSNFHSLSFQNSETFIKKFNYHRINIYFFNGKVSIHCQDYIVFN